MNGDPPDKIDQAIAEAELPQVEVIEIPVTLSSSGRPAVLAIPKDATDAELVDLAGWMLTIVRQHVREQRDKPTRPRLLVASRLPPS